MQVVILMGFKWYGRSYQQVLGHAVPECFATRADGWGVKEISWNTTL